MPYLLTGRSNRWNQIHSKKFRRKKQHRFLTGRSNTDFLTGRRTPTFCFTGCNTDLNFRATPISNSHVVISLLESINLLSSVQGVMVVSYRSSVHIPTSNSSNDILVHFLANYLSRIINDD
ncbi:hypothetical protein LXL04_031562 [Taraxacum kok-saghyz]